MEIKLNKYSLSIFFSILFIILVIYIKKGNKVRNSFFKKSLNAIIVNKLRSQSSVAFKFKDEKEYISLYLYESEELLIKVGDSVAKKEKSLTIKVYRKFNDNDWEFYRSFEK